jgi:hypothetical protein
MTCARFRTLILCLNLLCGTAIAAENSSIPDNPAGSGLLNVRDVAYGARGDGVTDDTAAIQKALSEALDTHRIVYLPNGTYLVSDSLKWWREGYNLDHVNGWGAFLQLQGQSRAGTVIRLKDKAEGFTKPEQPKAVLITGSRGYHGNKGYRSGEGNEAFENNIRDLTIDIGSGNAGGIGLDYQVSNAGAARNLLIRTSDKQGAGAVGIDLTRRDNGPGLIADVTIEGFAVGIRTGQDLGHFNAKNITLRNQQEVGIKNVNSTFILNGLISENSVPAVRNQGQGYFTLFAARLNGGLPAHAAIMNEAVDSFFIARDISVSGYKHIINNQGTLVAGTKLATWNSHPPLGGTIEDQEKIALPWSEPKPFAVPAIADWEVVKDPSGNDDSDRVQAALNSGKPVVALGAGRWFVSKSLNVPPHVKMITGLGAEFDGAKTPNNGTPLFILEGGTAQHQLIIDRMCIGGLKGYAIDHRDLREVVIRDLLFFSSNIYYNAKGDKRVFIENVAGNGYHFGPGTKVWADQWDTENGEANILDQAQMVAFGYKHEGHGPMLVARNGSRVNLYGGLIYSFGGVAATDHLITVIDSTASISLVNVTFVPNGGYPVPVQLVRGKDTVDIASSSLPRRGGGFALPMLIQK